MKQLLDKLTRTLVLERYLPGDDTHLLVKAQVRDTQTNEVFWTWRQPLDANNIKLKEVFTLHNGIAIQRLAFSLTPSVLVHNFYLFEIVEYLATHDTFICQCQQTQINSTFPSNRLQQLGLTIGDRFLYYSPVPLIIRLNYFNKGC